jgi:hypothetical protein
LPILYKDLCLSLRRLDSFVTAFILYSGLVVMLFWIYSKYYRYRMFAVYESLFGRNLFWGLLVVGFVGFSFRAVLVGARALASERDQNTLPLLEASPIGKTSFLAQKLLAPYLNQTLLLFGTLPFISLVFVTGGMSLAEVLPALISLFLWMQTATALGLFVSAKARTSSAAGSRAIQWMMVMWLLPWLVARMLAHPGAPFWNLGEIYRCVLGWVLLVSPPGMVAASDLSPEGILVFETLFSSANRYGGATLSEILLLYVEPIVSPIIQYPEVNAFYGEVYRGIEGSLIAGWVSHLLFQLLLLRLAINRWNRRLRSSAGTRRNRDRKNLFSTGLSAYFDLERTLLSRNSRLFGKPLWILALFAYGLGFLTGSIEVVLIAVVLPLGILILGLAPNSFRNERLGDTSVFNLTAPMRPRFILLGKWVFYLWQGFPFWGFGVAVLLSFFVFHRRVHRDFFFLYLAFGMLLPLLTLEGLVIGLRVSRKMTWQRFATGMKWGCLGMALLSVGVFLLIEVFPAVVRGTVGVGPDLINNHPVAFAYGVPVTIICLWMLQLHLGGWSPKDETVGEGRFRKRLTLGLLLYLLFDGISLLLFPVDFEAQRTVRTTLRFMIAGSWANWWVWLWIAHRPTSWWKEHLLVGE